MTTETPTQTITRAQLIEATEATITVLEVDGVAIPDSVLDAVRDVARTTERITGGWWDTGTECGCLIGTLYGPDAIDRYVSGGRSREDWSVEEAAEHELAVRFPLPTRAGDRQRLLRRLRGGGGVMRDRIDWINVAAWALIALLCGGFWYFAGQAVA